MNLEEAIEETADTTAMVEEADSTTAVEEVAAEEVEETTEEAH